MPEHVISNTSPLFYLHRLRYLDLLRELYQRIIVPDAVVDELQAGREQGEDVPEVAAYAWIDVRSVRIPEVVALITDLGAGEAQALALGLEEDPLLDVPPLGVRVVELLGDLLRALGVVGEHQLEPGVGTVQPARRVDPRSQPEPA